MPGQTSAAGSGHLSSQSRRHHSCAPTASSSLLQRRSNARMQAGEGSILELQVRNPGSRCGKAVPRAVDRDSRQGLALAQAFARTLPAAAEAGVRSCTPQCASMSATFLALAPEGFEAVHARLRACACAASPLQ